MNKLAIIKTELTNLIYKLDIKDIEQMLALKKKKSGSSKNKKSLEGIWADADIDIDEVEKELKKLRQSHKSKLDKIEL